MTDAGITAGWSPDRKSRFDLAPPRHFLLPAILLLLSEDPGYGYDLTRRLDELHFGPTDRPSVYRALAGLERDGLVESSAGPARAGQERRVYQITESGERALRAWMGVIKEERDRLDGVLRRYMATGTLDAILAGAEGGWPGVTGPAWSPVSSTSPVDGHRPRRDFRPRRTEHAGPAAARSSSATPRPSDRARFQLVPQRSVALVEARSTVGPITFGVIGIDGVVDADVRQGSVLVDPAPTAHLEINVEGLRSGNRLYDAELLRRIDARRHPIATLDLEACDHTGASNRYHVSGDLKLHGVSRPLRGSVTVVQPAADRLVVSGEELIDIRDFDIASPTVLMLRIYPDVRVRLHVEAQREG
jgi:PadR family transcriptional regulator